jgi:excisionase family DNA binding protein
MAGHATVRKLPPTSPEVSKAAADAAQRIGKALAKGQAAKSRRAAVETKMAALLKETILKATNILASGKRVSVQAEEEMLTTQQAADLLSVSRPYVVKLIESGKLKAINVGRYRRLNRSEVQRYKDAWIKSREAALDELAAISQKHGLGY